MKFKILIWFWVLIKAFNFQEILYVIVIFQKKVYFTKVCLFNICSFELFFAKIVLILNASHKLQKLSLKRDAKNIFKLNLLNWTSSHQSHALKKASFEKFVFNKCL